MPKTVVTTEHIAFIKENYLNMNASDIDRIFGVSKGVSRRQMLKLGLDVPKEVLSRLRAEKRRKPFTEQENEYIKNHIRQRSIKEMAKALGRSSTTIGKQCHALGLTELLEKKKKSSQFTKGNIPVNKGKKQAEYMTPEAIERTKGTRFQKGRPPHNALPNWSEVERIDKRNDRKYLLIKLPGQKKLMYKHIWVWEKKHGKKPRNHNIVFKDGNTLNCVIENLECISDAELMKRNSLHNNYSKELVEIIQLKGAVNRKINKLKSKNNEPRTPKKT